MTFLNPALPPQKQVAGLCLIESPNCFSQAIPRRGALGLNQPLPMYQHPLIKQIPLKYYFYALAALALGLFTLAALNGGTALTADANWDRVGAYLKTNFLKSTFLMVIVFAMLIMGIWQLKTGGRWQILGLIFGVIVLAVIGPDFFTGMATAVGDGTLPVNLK
jgi:hypothetical protein